MDIKRASEVVGREGGIVAICPEGTRSKDAPWQIGIAAIFKLAQKRLSLSKDKAGYFVFCDVNGIDFKDIVRNRVGGSSPYTHALVRYSAPIPFSEISITGSGSDVTRRIEDRYNQWKKS